VPRQPGIRHWNSKAEDEIGRGSAVVPDFRADLEDLVRTTVEWMHEAIEVKEGVVVS
jgi:hypothetical protein